MSDIVETPIDDLIADERCQARECMNWDAVSDYRAAYEAGKSLPALEIFRVRGKLIIVDGFHRREAAARAGVATLPVVVVGEGAMGDAIWEALSKNHHHGVQRTRADKRKAVRKALARDDSMSNRAIAKHCDVSRTFVANMRKRKVEQLELTMTEAITKEPRQTTNMTEIVEDMERTAKWFRGATKQLPKLADEASLERVTNGLRLAKDNVATATMPGDREAAMWLLKRSRDAAAQAADEAMEYVLRCDREIGRLLADLEQKQPRNVYKGVLASPHAFVKQCEQRTAQIEAAE